MHSFRAICVFFVFVPPFALPTALSQSEPKLVSLFCEEIVADPERAPAIVGSDQAWEQFARRLETRRVVSHLKVKSFPAYRTCVRTHRQDFEYGEFLLSGKKLLEEQQARQSLPRTVSLREQKGLLDREISLPLVGQVVIRPGRDFRADPVHSDNRLVRHARYGHLWNRFLEGVRHKARVYTNTIQFVKNLD